MSSSRRNSDSTKKDKKKTTLRRKSSDLTLPPVAAPASPLTRLKYKHRRSTMDATLQTEWAIQLARIPGEEEKLKKGTSKKTPLARTVSTPVRRTDAENAKFAASPKELDRLDVSGLVHRVHLHELLGQGGSAKVYRGTLHGLTFAVKVWELTYLSAEERDDVAKEAEIMTSMNHPSVARAFGYAVVKEEAWLVMEMFSCTFRDVLDGRRKERKEDDVLYYAHPLETYDILLQVLRGLQYMHGLEPAIMHRDVKSENCFVQRSRPRESQALVVGKTYRAQRQIDTVSLADFGEATRCDLASKGTLLPNVGTAEFMAPECIAAKRTNRLDYNEMCDMWSFGMLTFEALTTDIPYRREGISTFDLVEHVQAGYRPTLQQGEINPDLAPLVSVFERCTQADPSKRPMAKVLFRELLDLVLQAEADEKNAAKKAKEEK